MAQARSAWAINRRGKNLVRNLQYGPRTWLVRGMYLLDSHFGFSPTWISATVSYELMSGQV